MAAQSEVDRGQHGTWRALLAALPAASPFLVEEHINRDVATLNAAQDKGWAEENALH